MNPDTPTSNAASTRSAIVARTRKNFATRGLLYRHSLVLQGLQQFASLKHLAHDVAAADKLALHIELRNRRPVRIAFDPVPDFVGFEHIDAFVGHAEMVKDLDHLPGKSAHRKLRRALHEQHDVVGLHFIIDELLDAHGISSCWAAWPPRSRIYVSHKTPPPQEASEETS